MREAAESADVSAERWAEQYEAARPKMIANYRMDPAAYRKGLTNAGAPVGPATMEASTMSQQAAKEALAQATAPPAAYGGVNLTPEEAERLRAENAPRVDCFCNILAKNDQDKQDCNQVVEDYIFRRIEAKEMNEILAERFGKRQVKQAHKTASKHCLL